MLCKSPRDQGDVPSQSPHQPFLTLSGYPVLHSLLKQPKPSSNVYASLFLESILPSVNDSTRLSLYLRGSQETAICWWECRLGCTLSCAQELWNARQIQKCKEKGTDHISGARASSLHHLILPRNFKISESSKSKSCLSGHFEGIFLKVERQEDRTYFSSLLAWFVTFTSYRYTICTRPFWPSLCSLQMLKKALHKLPSTPHH